MKIKIEKQVLLKAVQTLENIVSVKATLPILTNILIETQKDKLRMVATDLKTRITITIPAEVKEEGSITVPAKKFGEIVRNLSGEELDISVSNKNVVSIKSGKCKFRITGLSTEEFPKLPKREEKEIVNLDQKILKEMLNLTAFAVSHNENRPILTGVLFRIKDKKLRIVATDGRRLALIEKKIDSKIEKEVIIPNKVVQELINNLDKGTIKLIFGKNEVYFEFDNIVLSSCLIEGEFPNYEKAIPKHGENSIILNRNNLFDVIKRASLLTSIGSQSIKIEVKKDKLIFSKRSETSEMDEEIDIKHKLEPFTVGFNPDYLMDSLKHLTDETISLELSGSENPAVIRKENYICIVLPMQFE